MGPTTDYLVVGAGASGLAFSDALVAETDAEVMLVDRRRGVGGHWPDAYPFVRLHTPSAYYGVNSLPLGEDRIDGVGENAGFYERATGEEVREHFAGAAGRLAGTGRVRILTGHEHVGQGADGEQVRELASGALHEVGVRRKVVDARYLEASVPATHTPSFEISPAARVVPVNELPAAAGSVSSSRWASTKPTSAALKQGEFWRTCWSTIRSGWNIGVAGASRRPSAVQSTCRTSGAVSTSPCSSTIRSLSIRRTRPSLTTSSICRTARSSRALSIVLRYIVAGRDGSMRETRPDASSRSKRSSMSAAWAAASASSEMPSMIPPTCSSG